MAHLAKCWCGKTYRCERGHVSNPNIIGEEVFVRHDPCPDFSFHGPIRGEVAYFSIESEKYIDPEEDNAQSQHN